MSQTATIMIIVGIFAYAIFMVIHGFSNFKSTSKDSESFFNADRGVSSFVLVCTTTISVFSGLSYYGYPAAIYRDGIGYFSGTGACVAGFLFVVIGYRLWLLGKQYGFLTPTDFLRSRYYSESYGLFVSILLVIFIVPYVALQLVAIGDGVVTTTNGMFPYVGAVALGTVCVSLHIIGGGMKSVAWLDTFHVLLGLGALIIVAIYLTKVYFPEGGLVEAANIVNNDPDLKAILSHPGPKGAYTWKGTLNNALTGAIATIVWPHIFMRCYIAKSTKNFRVMAWAMPLVYMVIFAILAVIGAIIAPAIVGPGFESTDSIMPILATQYCTPIIAFVSLLCLFAFAVSTSDSLLLSASAMASRDIYVRQLYELRGKTVEPKKVVTFSRIILLLLMVAILYITMLKPAYITDYAYKLSSPFFAMILPATIGGLFWRRGSKEGAWAGTVGGLATVTYFTFFAAAPMGLSALLWGMIANAVLYVGVSLATKVPEEVAVKYIDRITSMINTNTEVDEMVGSTIAAAKR